MEQKQALEKIKKLLSLSDNNPNEAEAKSAMLMAQKLMSKYDISLDDTKDEKAEFMIARCTHKWDMGFRIPLSTVISENFRVENFLSNGTVCFFGHRLDAEIAKETFNYAYSFINTMANRAYNTAKKEGRSTKGVYNSYAQGFILGLKQEFDKQCKALKIITPEDVKEEYLNMSSSWKTKSHRNQSTIDFGAYMSGVNDGKQFMSKKQIQQG